MALARLSLKNAWMVWRTFFLYSAERRQSNKRLVHQGRRLQGVVTPFVAHLRPR
jgi:hypothetical protein